MKQEVNIRKNQLLYNNIAKIGNSQQNIPKNPIVFFLTYLYRWFFYYVYYSYYKLFPIKTIQIANPTEKYIEKNKKKFINSFQCIRNMNTNIEPVFYNKKELQKTLVDTNNQLEKIWRTRILIENTPRGNIIMHYDVYKNGFAYYSDMTGIPYFILNAVAMKYVIVYNCRDFYMDNEKLEEDKESPLIKLYLEEEKEKPEIEKKTLPKLDNSAFAKLKNYQLEPESDNKINDANENKKPEKEYNRNIFINLGRITNFKPLQKPERKNKLNGFYSKLLDDVTSECELQNQIFSYSKFKELFMKKN